MRTLSMLSVVAPVCNERDNLAVLYERLVQALDPLGCAWELILVDDGSTDGSDEAIRELHREDPRVKALFLSRNFGHEPASTAGLRAALGDAAVLMDADLQDPPEVIPDMVARWREGYDIVSAQRRSRNSDSLVKRATAYAFYRVMDWLVRWEFPKDIGNFRLLDRAPLDAFLDCPERSRVVRALTAWTGFSKAIVPFDRAPRHAGVGKYKLRNILGLVLACVTGFSNTPLRVASILGMVITGFALLAGLALLVILVLGSDVSGYAWLMVSVWFLGGVQCLFIGVLGEYIGKIHLEVRQRPLYFVRETLGIDDDPRALQAISPANKSK